ncbi:MAG: carboxypeptidase-like regulatory domain-containing protein [Candidatus Acidiferrum sp.]
MRRTSWQICMLILMALLVLTTVMCAAQDQAPPPKKDQAPAPANRLTIEVTAGDSNKPVENASVYVKTIEEHLIKDKKFEVNVKTNQEGVAHVPDAPMGRVLVQIVADGWKPYGHWYDITDPKQVIKIHLERPPKWY